MAIDTKNQGRLNCYNGVDINCRPSTMWNSGIKCTLRSVWMSMDGYWLIDSVFNQLLPIKNNESFNQWLELLVVFFL